MTRIPPKILMAAGAIALIGAMSAQPASSQEKVSPADLEVHGLIAEVQLCEADVTVAIPADKGPKRQGESVDLRIGEPDEAGSHRDREMNDLDSGRGQIDRAAGELSDALTNAGAAQAGTGNGIDKSYGAACEDLRSAWRELQEAYGKLVHDHSKGERRRRKKISKGPRDLKRPTSLIATGPTCGRWETRQASSSAWTVVAMVVRTTGGEITVATTSIGAPAGTNSSDAAPASTGK